MKGPLTQGMPPLSDRYVAQSWVAAGGMQHVYRAYDQLFERVVALKTPKDDGGIVRFEKSAEVSARVNHQNVAKTLDYFVQGDRPFLVEEMVEGKDLEKVMSGTLPFLPPSTCARIFHQLAKGLAASHAVGVVHRDLKPSNVMVVGGPLFKDIKITDFGIAKMAEKEIGQWVEDGGGQTSSKTVLGAIPYMSPEAISDFKVAKTSSDVWAIAAIIYQLMSGELPFGKGLISITKIMAAAPPKKPNQLQSVQFKSLGTQVYDLVVLCMDKDEDKRPTAQQLVTLLEDLCYSITTYGFGLVSEIQQFTGRIIGEDGDKLMWHPKCFYGTSKVNVGTRVWFGRDKGEPWDRAFPIGVAP